ncbi:MAG: hypothetical protein HW374_736 [Bacteroidetes bacterium]|nr:hypothetical protein [Bacteroidota bacterium]
MGTDVVYGIILAIDVVDADKDAFDLYADTITGLDFSRFRHFDKLRHFTRFLSL